MQATIDRLTSDLLYFTAVRDYKSAIVTIDLLKAAHEVGEAQEIPDLD
jgi:hypothetical protein